MRAHTFTQMHFAREHTLSTVQRHTCMHVQSAHSLTQVHSSPAFLPHNRPCYDGVAEPVSLKHSDKVL